MPQKNIRKRWMQDGLWECFDCRWCCSMPTLSRTSMYQLYELAALNTYCSTRLALQNNLPISWHGNGAGKARFGVGNHGKSQTQVLRHTETKCGSLGIITYLILSVTWWNINCIVEGKQWCAKSRPRPRDWTTSNTESNQTISAASLGACLLTVHTAQDLWLQANFAMSFQLSDESIFA